MKNNASKASRARRWQGALLAVGLILSASAQAQGVFKWVDEKGQVHYGDRPSQGAGAASKKLDSRQLGSTPDNLAAQKELVLKGVDSAKAKKDQAQVEKSAADRAERERARDRDCAQVREVVRQYSSGQRVALIDDKGERRVMENDEVAQRLEAAKKQESDTCSPLPPDPVPTAANSVAKIVEGGPAVKAPAPVPSAPK